MFNFLTPEFFSALVLIIAVIGLVLAAIRIRNDFRRGPRWPDNPPTNSTEPVSRDNLEELKHD